MTLCSFALLHFVFQPQSQSHFIEFRDNRMFIKHIVSHSEYDKLCTKYAKESK